MMLRLTRRSSSPVPLEAPCIAPDKLAPLSVQAIENLPVQHGNRAEPFAEHFQVSGDPTDQHVVLEGDCSRVKWLGAAMTAGRLVVIGPAGMHAGSGMIGGRLEIEGHADDWLGAEMRGGFIHVRRSAGHYAGAGYPGSRRGMRGGEIIIDGASGDGTGAVMRRGLIATGGCGEFTGASMIAGSVFVFDSVGRFAGAAMKRGSIVVCGREPELLPTFRFSCAAEFAYLNLYFRHLERLGCAPAGRMRSLRAKRYCGDLVERGLGEILCVV